MSTFLSILNCIVLGAFLLDALTRNKLLKNKIDRIEKDNIKLRVQNRELAKYSIYKYKYTNITCELESLQYKVLSCKISGKRFCEEVARIIKTYNAKETYKHTE